MQRPQPSLARVQAMLIVYEPGTAVDRQAACQLADRLGIDPARVCQSDQYQGDELALVYVDGRWQLQSADSGHQVAIDFCTSRWRHRLRPSNLNGEYLVRALRGRQRDLSGSTVLDATAGLGGDSLLLAAAGFDVTLVERLPVLVYLLECAIADALDDDMLGAIVARMTPVHDDSTRFMASLLHSGVRPDFVYLDPMYAAPAASGQQTLPKRSAAPRKEMVVLQELSDRLMPVGSDAAGLLESALAVAGKKVIVKRPLHAPSLANAKPSARLAGRAARFDIYAV